MMFPLHLVLPLVQRSHDNRYGADDAHRRQYPAEYLDDLQLVALIQPALGRADPTALDEPEERVNQHAGDDPEYRR